jgi:hypothetical protein
MVLQSNGKRMYAPDNLYAPRNVLDHYGFIERRGLRHV